MKVEWAARSGFLRDLELTRARAEKCDLQDFVPIVRVEELRKALQALKSQEKSCDYTRDGYNVLLNGVDDLLASLPEGV
jgi:hypothetical protein